MSSPFVDILSRIDLKTDLFCVSDVRRLAQHCFPPFSNAGFNLPVYATNTCGMRGPQRFCNQVWWTATSSCDYCDASVPQLSHSANFMTDLDSFDNKTWWQSETMFEGVDADGRHGVPLFNPDSVIPQVNLTINLGEDSLRFQCNGPGMVVRCECDAKKFVTVVRCNAMRIWIQFLHCICILHFFALFCNFAGYFCAFFSHFSHLFGALTEKYQSARWKKCENAHKKNAKSVMQMQNANAMQKSAMQCDER
jgi:hypothetical protein